jgi:hypothetical protein
MKQTRSKKQISKLPKRGDGVDEPGHLNPSASPMDIFEIALKASDPIEALKTYAQELSIKGLKRKEVYNRFLDFYVILQNSNSQTDEIILGDVMDMIANTFSPFNLDLPQ